MEPFTSGLLFHIVGGTMSILFMIIGGICGMIAMGIMEYNDVNHKRNGKSVIIFGMMAISFVIASIVFGLVR